MFEGKAGVDPLTTTDPLTHTTSVTYGDNQLFHVPTGFTDESGLTWWATHNPFGQLLTANPPAGSPTGQTSVVYDESNGPNRGYPRHATDGNGDVVSFDSYDPLGDLTSICTYPIHGNTNVKNTSQFFYDAVQRLTTVVNPDGTSSQAVYNGHNLSYTLDEKATRYDYSYCAACGLLNSIAGPLGWGLHWSYDGDKDLTSFTDARGKVTSYSYGTAGDLNRITYPDGTHEDVRFDRFGRVSQLINGRGTAISLGYDASERITSVTSPDANLTYSYYADGSLSSFTDGVGITSFTYTPRGEVQTVTYDYRASGLPNVQVLTYSYNPDGSRASLNWSGVGTWTYGYDAGGRLTSVVNPWNQTTTWAYDGEGKLTSQSNANNTSTVYAYNQQRGWPTSITHKRGFATINSYTLTYDNGLNTVGLLTAAQEPDGAVTGYSYDQLYRLATESRVGDQQPYSNTYGYDLAGNRTSANGVTSTFDDANKRTAAAYDADGNQLLVTSGAATWNSLDQLTRIGQGLFSYAYDAVGRRVTRDSWYHLLSNGTAVNARTFYVFDGNRLLGEIDVPTSSNYSHNPVTRAAYTWGAAGLVSEQLVDTNRPLWYHFGPQGETRFLTDSANSIADTYRYSAYGEIYGQTGTDPNPFRFGGQFGYYNDQDIAGWSTDLHLCGARWYSASAGRWLSRDPIGYDGGPNLYEYCESDPVGWVDPDGTQGVIKAQNAQMWSVEGYRKHLAQAPPLSDAEYHRRQRARAEDWLRQFIAKRQKDMDDHPERLAMACPVGSVEVEVEALTVAAGKAIRARILAARGARAAGSIIRNESHHLFPKAFATFFKSAGINIEDYKVLNQAAHKLIHGKGGGQAWTDSWNMVWKRWIDSNRNATKQDIFDQLARMRKSFGI